MRCTVRRVDMNGGLERRDAPYAIALLAELRSLALWWAVWSLADRYLLRFSPWAEIVAASVCGATMLVQLVVDCVQQCKRGARGRQARVSVRRIGRTREQRMTSPLERPWNWHECGGVWDWGASLEGHGGGVGGLALVSRSRMSQGGGPGNGSSAHENCETPVRQSRSRVRFEATPSMSTTPVEVEVIGVGSLEEVSSQEVL